MVINYSKLNCLRTCICNFTDGKRIKANGVNHSHHKCKGAEVNGRFLHFSPSHFFTSKKQLMTLESITKKKRFDKKIQFKGKEMELGTLTGDFNYKRSQISFNVYLCSVWSCLLWCCRFCNSAICIDNDPAKQGNNEAF